MKSFNFIILSQMISDMFFQTRCWSFYVVSLLLPSGIHCMMYHHHNYMTKLYVLACSINWIAKCVIWSLVWGMIPTHKQSAICGPTNWFSHTGLCESARYAFYHGTVFWIDIICFSIVFVKHMMLMLVTRSITLTLPNITTYQ